MLVLRNSLLLNAHEYTLTDTPQAVQRKPDKVKLTLRWITDATQSPPARSALIAAIAALHDAGIRVVVHGIKTAEQLALAHAAGADEMQGFYVGQPTLRV
jgi:EAL domain-containing protein (putative c-di-GMP-specific phosphodiesterase class I)